MEGFGLLRDPSLGIALSSAVNGLGAAIREVMETATRFKPVLSRLNDTVRWLSSRTKDIISMSRDSEDEIQRLLDLLKEAKKTVDKCTRISSWNYFKKYKMAKKLMELDNSIRTTVQLFSAVTISEDSRHILDSFDELKLILFILFRFLLDDFNSSAKDTGGKISDVTKVSLEKFVKSQPAEVVNDIALWKRKKLSGSLLVSSTATWLLQQVYEYNFITIASWVIILIVTLLFFWRKVDRFLDRKEATKPRLEEIREKAVMEIANACWELTDQVMRWVFNVTDDEREWFVFPQTVAFLLVFSLMGRFFDLPTLCKVIMAGTSVPVMCAKHRDKVKDLGSMVRMQSGRVCEMVGEMLTDAVNKPFVEDKKAKKKGKKQN